MMKRREAEWAAATTPHGAQLLLEKWAEEDVLIERAQSAEGKRLASIERRLAAIERLLGPGGRKLIDPVCKALGEVLPRYFGQQMEKHKVLKERGVWSADKDYRPGDLVTHKGAGWVAQLEGKGLRPGDGAGWRLAINSGSGS